jgi:catechol 2,3-dioxygenase-like lactoylglutathione lyase family enzyme
MRKDSEPPPATAARGWRYHHLGIPTTTPRAGERYLPQFGMYVSGFDTSPYGVEWMRFEPGSPLPASVQSQPHIAFEVDDLDAALEGLDIVMPPGRPSEGVRAAMIVDDGALIELIEFR